MTHQKFEDPEYWKSIENSHRRGKVAGGLLIIAIGSLFLAREMGQDFPGWLFSWKTLLIAIGLVLGIKHGFRRPGWLIMVLVGSAFLIGDLYPELTLKPYLFPVILIVIGLFVIFKPSRHRHTYWHKKRYGHAYTGERCGDRTPGTPHNEDHIESTSVFGSVKKNVISKNFRGGEVTNIFGGSEINLMQADFSGTATLEVTQVFGGTRLIIPAHWRIKSDIVTVLGGLEDKRQVAGQPDAGSEKLLILNGSTFFGGIEISSY